MKADITIDMDKTCPKCGEPGVPCLKCAAKEIGKRTALKVTMKAVRYAVSNKGEITIGWRMDVGDGYPEVVVKAAQPLPDGRLIQAANAIVPHAAKLLDLEDGIAENMVLARLILSPENGTVQMTLGMPVAGSDTMASFFVPPVAFQSDKEGQAVMWADMRSTVTAFLNELDRYAVKVLERMAMAL